MMSPYIYKNDDGSVEIIGESEGLEALGHMLLLKAKLGNRMVARFTDGTNPPILITSRDDLVGEDNEPHSYR